MASIAELIMAPALARSQAMRHVGDLQAQHAITAGNAWSQAAQNIGQIISGTVGQVLQYKADEPRRQYEQMQLGTARLQQLGEAQKIEANRTEMVGRKALSDAIKANTQVGPDGGVVINHQGVAAEVAKAGFPQQAESWLKTAAANQSAIDELDAKRKAYAQASIDAIGGLAQNANSLDDFKASLGLASVHGVLSEADAHRAIDQAVQAGPDGWKTFKDHYVGLTTAYKQRQAELQKPVKVGPDEQVVIPGVDGGTPTVLASGKPKPVKLEQAEVMVGGKPTIANYNPETGAYTDQAGQPIAGVQTTVKTALERRRVALEEQKALQEAQANVELSDTAVDVLARRALKNGGDVPGFGMGKTGAQNKIRVYNAMALMDPNVDLAANAANFAADKGSLAKMQQMRDAVVSFEATAKDNLKLFVDQAKKIADTGSPLLNTPIRDINTKLLGSDELAAYNAARRVAVNEVAKVTGNPTLNGQLSDSARHEVESFVPENATLGQTLAVAKILLRDMDNRHVNLDRGLEAIQARIGGASAATAPAAKKNPYR